MAGEKQIPLDELLFGPKSEPTDKPVPTLADAISVCFREGQAQLRRDQPARRSSLPRPPGEPTG
jgi:hypothetical protein